MSQPNAVIEALHARRSAKARDLAGPAPSAEEVAILAQAAAAAPDHGRLVPFRLMTIGEAQRPRFAGILEAAAREMQPGIADSEAARSRDKALEGPFLLAFIARIDPEHPKIPASDQWLTAGCALENILLALQSLGFSAAVRSGKFLETDAVRAGFGLANTEHFTCFMAIGRASALPPQKPRPGVDAILSAWSA